MTDKLKHKIITYLNEEYSGLIPYETDKLEDTIFFMKNGKLIYEYNKKNEVIYIYYSNVWSFLDSFFKLKYDEIENLTKVWIVGHYKSNTTIFIVKGDKNKLVEEHYKLDANDR